MENKTDAEVEALVLQDDQGNYYAIPRQTLERHRLSEEQKAQLEKLTGSDVSGYMWKVHSSFVFNADTPLTTPPHQAIPPELQRVFSGVFKLIPGITLPGMYEPGDRGLA